jgi:hypothetical protein
MEHKEKKDREQDKQFDKNRQLDQQRKPSQAPAGGEHRNPGQPQQGERSDRDSGAGRPIQLDRGRERDKSKDENPVK